MERHYAHFEKCNEECLMVNLAIILYGTFSLFESMLLEKIKKIDELVQLICNMSHNDSHNCSRNVRVT